MSRNVSHCKVKKLDRFAISLEAFYNIDEEWKWAVELTYTETDVNVVWAQGGEIKGKVFGENDKDYMEVEEIEMTGDFSGAFFDLKEIFKDSKGRMELVLIYESGEEIVKYMVENGEVTTEDIEL